MDTGTPSPPPSPTPSDEPGSLTAMRARWALRTLDDTHQEVLRLVMGERLTIRQAAVVLGCRPVTVRLRLRRARARLAAALDAAEASRRCVLKRAAID